MKVPDSGHDSACDDPAKPTIYVTFKDYEAYPEYLIEFKTN